MGIELARSLVSLCSTRSLAREFPAPCGLRPGQALMELAVGLFATALVLATLFGCTYIILDALDLQRPLRAKAGRAAMESTAGDGVYSTAQDHTEIAVEDFAAKYLFGTKKIDVKEEVHLPAMGLLP